MSLSYRATMFIVLLLWLSIGARAAKYNGQTVSVNNDYLCFQIGTTDKSIIKEVSGLACSRVTPGYLWAEKDEGTSSIIALTPGGKKAMTLILSGMNSRDDWEDICTGTYNDTHYIFIGAFGDNDTIRTDDYYIVCVPEPAVTSTVTTAAVSLIRFGFPDGAAHNVETLMYDSHDETFYIIDKANDVVPTLYQLPMSTNYGSELQRLSAGQKLGKKSDKWHNITAGDISPDGSRIAIKNKKVILLWNRNENETVAEALKHQPEQIGTYLEEEQGESLAWLDNYTFYTTSDSKEDTPIYVYQNINTPTSLQNPMKTSAGEKVLINGHLYIRYNQRTYSSHGVMIK